MFCEGATLKSPTTTPQPRRLRGATAIAFAAIAALTLGGCAGGAEEGPSEQPEVNLTDTGADVDQVTVAFPGSLANLYIGQESGILNYNLAATVQEGLVARDGTGKIIPALAESWETPDDTTYVFTLREDAKFHNGDPVTADDIAFSIQMAADPEGSPGTYYYLMNLDSAEVTGDQEVTVKTVNPDASFLINLSSAGALVVTQRAFWEENDGNVGTSQSLLLGTGPYEVTEFQPDSHVTLERVDTWWGGVPKAKTIRVNFIPDSNTRLAAAQKGDVDIAFNVPINQAKQWSSIDGTRVESMNDLSYVGLLFDQNVPPFDDLAVRQAISHSIDKNTIAEKLLRGYGEVATAVMTPESLTAAHDADASRELLSSIPQYDFDLEEGKQLIESSSVPTGFETELTYPNTGPQVGVAAQAIAESLKEIGVEITVREVPIEEWLSTIGDGEHGLGFMWYFSTTGSPAEINSYLLGPENPNGFDNEEANSLIDEIQAESDPKIRIDKLVELETLSADQAVNAPMWWGKSVTFFSNSVGLNDYSAYTFTGMWGADLFAAEAK